MVLFLVLLGKISTIKCVTNAVTEMHGDLEEGVLECPGRLLRNEDA